MRPRAKKWRVVVGVLAIGLIVLTSQVFAHSQDEEFLKLYKELRTNFFEGRYSQALANIEVLMANLEELKVFIEKEISSRPRSPKKQGPLLAKREYPNQVMGTIPSAIGEIRTMAMSPNGKYLYVCNRLVEAIRTSDNTVVAKISLEKRRPTHVSLTATVMAITPDAKYVYVTNEFSNTVSVIQTSDNTVVNRIPVGRAPIGIAITPDGKYAYVANWHGFTISVIQTSDNTVVDEISLDKVKDCNGKIEGYLPEKIAFTPDGKYAYVIALRGGDGSRRVLVIRTSDVTEENPGPGVIDVIPVAGSLIVMAPNGKRAYVIDTNGGVKIVRTLDNSVVDKFYIGPCWGADVTPDGRHLYLTELGGKIRVCQTVDNTTVAEISVGGKPTRIAISPDGKYAYVALRHAYHMLVIGPK